MDPLKVLVLDSWGIGVWWIADEENVDVEAEMFPDVDVYAAEHRVLEFIREHAADYGLVIIGNNLGAGVFKAAFVPEAMWNRSVVVWNDEPTESMKAQYKQLGYQHFTSRRNLSEFLEQHPEIYR